MHALLLMAVLAQAKPVDISSFKDKLHAVTDGKGHYLMFSPENPYESASTFWGDGKTFNALAVIGGGRSGDESWEFSFWDPRVSHDYNGYAMVNMKDAGSLYTLSCDQKETKLTEVKGEELAKLLKAQFLPRKWTRIPERLLRDDSGTYYFVDRLRTEQRSDRRDFRVYMGARGKMKLLPLKDIVDDSKGTIFATPSGNLRLIAEEGKPAWVSGNKRVQLIEVPIEENVRMIYLDLGPYTGQQLGTPCDENM